MTKQNKESGEQGSPAEALLNFAQQYHLAATTLFPLHRKAEAPLYFLYTHTIELALKGYLRSHGVPIRSKHALGLLLDECRRNGLNVHSDLAGVIHLLESENKLHGFRYFVFRGAGKPEVEYLREVVDELMTVVTEEVKKKPSADLGKGAVFKFIVGKPEKK